MRASSPSVIYQSPSSLPVATTSGETPNHKVEYILLLVVTCLTSTDFIDINGDQNQIEQCSIKSMQTYM